MTQNVTTADSDQPANPVQATVPTPAPLEAATVPAGFQRTAARYADRPALRTVDGSVSYTWSELAALTRQAAQGMHALGVRHSDTVGVLLPNIIECHVLDFAAAHLGAIPFSIFNSAPAEQIVHQLRTADAEVVITNRAFQDKVSSAVAALDDQVKHLVIVDGDELGDHLTLRRLLQLEAEDFDFDETWRSVAADDVATLIYTSGTTGPPKAAQWSNRTVMSQQRALDAALPLPTESIVSFLPMAHAGGRITVHYMALAYGATITVCPDPRELLSTMATVHPDAFFSVPRFWEKIQVAIEGMIQAAPDGDREALQQATQTGLDYTRQIDAGWGPVTAVKAISRAEYDDATAVLRPLLAKLGLDRVKSAFVGGAPSTPELSQFFRSVGVPMLEAYGLTEGSLDIFNRVEHFKSGTAGKPLPGVEIKLAEDGELLVRSDLNFVGYRHQPEATADAVDADGWLHTGDVAAIDEDGFVRVIDRKKELIINSAGKNMSPVTIESAISAESSLIGQVMAIGDQRRFVTALITIDPEALRTFAFRCGLGEQDPEALLDGPEVRAEITAAVDRGNLRLNNNEQVKKFVLLPLWLPDSDELTPTAKLKRRAIAAKYADHIEGLYA
jgi:long-subunit acyl-CoA synthetase (AMP-forming)